MIKIDRKFSNIFLRNNKPILVGIAILLVITAVNLSGGSNASYTDSITKNDAMKMGSLHLDLVMNKNAIQNVEPGATYQLPSYVENLGTLEGNLRVKVDMTYAEEEDFEYGYYYKSGLSTDNVTINFDQEFENNFTLHEDGYYYLNRTIEKKERINLIDSITFDYHLTNNDYQSIFNTKWFAYRIIAEVRQVPKNHSETINGIEVSYDIPEEEWVVVDDSTLTINKRPINDEKPPIDVIVTGVEQVGEELVITFDRDIEKYKNRLAVGSSGEVALIDDFYFNGNQMFVQINKEAFLPEFAGAEFEFYVREYLEFTKLYEDTIIVN